MERIRRAGTRIAGGDLALTGAVDVGFRVLRVDTTNMTDVLRTPDEVEQGELALYTSSVKPGRTAEDLLFQVIVDWGLDLSLPVTTESIEGRGVFIVDEGALIACFADSVGPKVVSAIAERQPLRAVFRDSAFESDADRINAEQVFRERSPRTEVKAI